MPKNILIIDDDESITRLIGIMLVRAGYEISTASSGQEGLEKVFEEQPDLVILDMVMPDMTGADVCRRIRSQPELADLPILMLSGQTEVDDKVIGLKAGANDYVTKPVHRDELIARMEVLLRPELDVMGKGRVIAVLGVKPGIGTTTIAANLALALQTLANLQVILMDAHSPFGDLDLLLNSPASRSWADLAPYIDDLDDEILGKVLTPHATGIKLLLAPSPNEAPPELSSDAFTTILNRLRNTGDFIVVDTPPVETPDAAAILQSADEVVVVLTPDLATLSLTLSALDWIAQARPTSPNLHLVLNRVGIGLSPDNIEKRLNLHLSAKVTDDELTFLAAANRGIPVFSSDPRSKFAQQMQGLASLMASESVRDVKNPTSDRPLSGFLRGLRRD